jgi:Ser/Thr protein kinase RdoA (MazF antagonist)
MSEADRLRELLSGFGLAYARELPGLVPPGSPERCLERRVLADARGRAWVLERLAPGQAVRREAVARLLRALARVDPDLAARIPTYRPLAEGQGFVLAAQGAAWQLSPFVPGLALPRPDYLDHAWRGAAVAEFIVRLHDVGGRLDAIPPAPQADLPALRDRLFAVTQRREPGLTPRLARYRTFLDGLPELLAGQASSLAHGDLHPLNIQWGEREIRAVIDWEFTGARPLLYDAANCIGCAGFEEPSGLGRGFVTALVARLKEAWGAAALAALPDMVLAGRMGWLSEWLRAGDAELVGLELDYLDLLLDGRAELARLWPGVG